MSAETLPRVFFDTNEGSEAHGYWLTLPQSRADLAAISALRDGLEVILYMPDELELRATLRFEGAAELGTLDHPEGAWVADPIPGTIRYLG